jgi:hypothetical protein
MKYLATKEKLPLEHAYIIQMAYAGNPREREFDENAMKINELHTGRSTSGSDIYPGDATIRFEDSICIQLHKVKLKNHSIRWGGKIAYTLAIFYPNEFAIDYVTTESVYEE